MLPDKASLSKFEKVTTSENILKAIFSLKSGSTPGNDKMTNGLLKKYVLIFCKLLSHMFNL